MGLFVGAKEALAVHVGAKEALAVYRGADLVWQGGGEWNPGLLPGLVAWYAADDDDTIHAVGDRVTQWDDKSSNGHNLTPETTSFRPYTGQRTINGHNAIRFVQSTGSSTLGLRALNVPIPGPVTVAIVMQHESYWAVMGNVAVALRDTGGYGLVAGGNGTAGDTTWKIKGTTPLAGGTVIIGAPMHSVAVLNGPNSLLRVNGLEVITGDAGDTSGDRIAVSNNGAPGSIYGLYGFVLEVIVVNGVVEGDNLTKLENYLTGRRGGMVLPEPTPPPAPA